MKISPKQKKVIITDENGHKIEVDNVDFIVQEYHFHKYDITLDNLISELSKHPNSTTLLDGVKSIKADIVENVNDKDSRKTEMLELVSLYWYGDIYFYLLTIYLALNNTKQVIGILDYHYNECSKNYIFISRINLLITSLRSSSLDIDRSTINYIIDWVEKNETIALEESNREIDNYEADERIQTSVPKETIEHYFSQLSEVKGNIHPSKPILSELEVKNLLQANFQTFNPKIEKKLIKLNHSNKGVIKYFIYHYYRNIDYGSSRNNQKKYCQLLIDNFECYQNNTIESISKNFSKKPSKYPISNSI